MIKIEKNMTELGAINIALTHLCEFNKITILSLRLNTYLKYYSYILDKAKDMNPKVLRKDFIELSNGSTLRIAIQEKMYYLCGHRADHVVLICDRYLLEDHFNTLAAITLEAPSRIVLEIFSSSLPYYLQSAYT